MTDINVELYIDDLTELLVRGARNRVDLGDAISVALGEAARRLGGASHLIAGRPGSWEAQDLLHLAHGHLLDDPAMDVKVIGY